MTQPAFGLIIPCFNYASRLAASVDRIARFRAARDLRFVVCLVDDGSTDDTPRVMEELRARHGDWLFTHRTSRNKGKGNAIREGAEKLGNLTPFFVFTDCDLYYGLDVIADRILPALQAGADVVILDRSWNKQFNAGSALRRLVSYTFNHVKTILTGVTFEDSQAGMKGFRADFFHAVIPVAKINGFAFDVELLSIAVNYRFRVEQIPIRRLATHTPEGSSVTLRNAVRMLLDLSRIARAQFSNAYSTPWFEERVAKQVYEIRDEEHS